MNKQSILVILLILFSTSDVLSDRLNLKEYLDQLQANNLAIQASNLRALAQKHKILPSGTLDDPFIAAGIDEIPFNGGGGKVWRYQISQSIPFPGKLGMKSDLAERKAEVSESDAQTMLRKIKVVGTQAFLKTSYNNQAIILTERIQKIIRETTASEKSRYKTGSSNHHEWLLAKLELSVLDVELLRLKRTQKTLTALLNELRNMPPESPIEVDHRDLLSTEAESNTIVSNLDAQPELKSWKAEKKAAESELRLVKLSYAPDFVIQGMAMEPMTRDSKMSGTSNWGVMIGITIPIFFWKKQSELVAAAEKNKLATIADYQSLENRLTTEVSDAKQQLKTAIDVVKLYKNDVIPITEIAVKSARSAYAAKTLPMTQLLGALRSQRTQEQELLAAQMDVIVSKTRIEELLSNPPLIRFAPARPTFFGGEMGKTMDSSDTINMGSGMSGPTRKQSTSDSSASPGMGGM